MSTSISLSSAALPITAISVPDSANFIGSADDAALLQMTVLLSTADRMRDNLKAEAQSTSRLINAIDALSGKLDRFGKLIKNSWTPVSYSNLSVAPKDSTSLRALFSADGPNLGKTLAESNAEFEILRQDGIQLNAPVQTPVMIEQFTAVKDRVNLNSTPDSGSFSWYGAQDLQKIDMTGASPGSYAGSTVKTVEQRDSSGKLISVTRYTVFGDYANRRTTQIELATAFQTLQQRILPLLAELESLLAQVSNKTSALEKRIQDDANTVSETEAQINSAKDRQVTDLKNAMRLVRLLRIELQNSLLQVEKPSFGERGLEDEHVQLRHDSPEQKNHAGDRDRGNDIARS